MGLKEHAYGDGDFLTNIWFESGGVSHEAVEEQIQFFGEEVLPVLRQECGGGARARRDDRRAGAGRGRRVRRLSDVLPGGRAMADVDDIVRLTHDYALYNDTFQVDALVDLFVSDAFFDMTPAGLDRYEGRDDDPRLLRAREARAEPCDPPDVQPPRRRRRRPRERHGVLSRDRHDPPRRSSRTRLAACTTTPTSARPPGWRFAIAAQRPAGPLDARPPRGLTS